MFGKHHSEETLNKISESKKGQIAWNKGQTGLFKHTEETKNLMSEQRKGELNPMYGKTHTDDVKKRLSKANSGENHPNYGKPAWNKGLSHSEESRELMSKARIKFITPEYREKLSEKMKGEMNPMYGKTHTEETKQKISEQAQGKYNGEKNPNAKVTETQVREIKILLREKKLLQREISKIYGLGENIIYKISSGLTWKHVNI